MSRRSFEETLALAESAAEFLERDGRRRPVTVTYKTNDKMWHAECVHYDCAAFSPIDAAEKLLARIARDLLTGVAYYEEQASTIRDVIAKIES